MAGLGRRANTIVKHALLALPRRRLVRPRVVLARRAHILSVGPQAALRVARGNTQYRLEVRLKLCVLRALLENTTATLGGHRLVYAKYALLASTAHRLGYQSVSTVQPASTLGMELACVPRAARAPIPKIQAALQLLHVCSALRGSTLWRRPRSASIADLASILARRRVRAPIAVLERSPPRLGQPQWQPVKTARVGNSGPRLV